MLFRSDPERLARILSRTFLTTSARNQFSCTLLSIQEKGINGLVQLQLGGGEIFFADITMKSIHNMGLIHGCNAYAIIKSSDVVICNTPPHNSSDINILKGQIKSIESLDDTTEITFTLNGEELLTGVIPFAESQSLQIGTTAYACIKTQHIILGL